MSVYFHFYFLALHLGNRRYFHYPTLTQLHKIPFLNLTLFVLSSALFLFFSLVNLTAFYFHPVNPTLFFLSCDYGSIFFFTGESSFFSSVNPVVIADLNATKFSYVICIFCCV